MTTKKIPIRMCAACRTGRPKRELLRVVRSPEGEISVDVTGKKSGRGAYICKDPKCLAKARKARCFERAFSCEIGDEVYARLAGEVEAAMAETTPAGASCQPPLPRGDCKGSSACRDGLAPPANENNISAGEHSSLLQTNDGE